MEALNGSVHGNMHVFVLSCLRIYLKTQKHVCFHVLSPFCAFTPITILERRKTPLPLLMFDLPPGVQSSSYETPSPVCPPA